MVKPQNLGCPYCGSMFNLKNGMTGYGEGERVSLTGYICANDDCEAEWNASGFPTLAPRAEFE